MSRKLINIILVIIIILAFIAVVVMQKIEINSITTEEISKYMPGSVIYAVMLLMGLYCLKAVAFIIPMALLYISAGVILPPFWAIILTFICLAAEMTIGFYMGRHMGHSQVMEKVAGNKKVSKLTGYVENNSFFSCFVARFVPGFPTDLVSMLLGTTNIKFSIFVWFYTGTDADYDTHGINGQFNNKSLVQRIFDTLCHNYRIISFVNGGI
jgi:uncharacterized membrane protein YdjX (TVP38/TMEM64 family)